MVAEIQILNGEPVILPGAGTLPIASAHECVAYLTSHTVRDAATARWYGRVLVLFVLDVARRLSNYVDRSDMTKRLDQYRIHFEDRVISRAFEAGVEEALDILHEATTSLQAVERIYASLQQEAHE